MSSLIANDIIPLIELLANATNPLFKRSLQETRDELISSVSRMIRADVWIWTTGESNPRVRGDAMITSFVDRGFRDDQERAEFLRVIVHPDLTPVVTGLIHDAMMTRRPITRSRSQLIAPRAWRASSVSKIWAGIGFSDFILSVYPVGDLAHSGVGFHRRKGAARFTTSDLAVVQLIFEHVRWLHQAVEPPAEAAKVINLSPRERHVMLHLTNGYSRKQIAQKLRLSEHTVTDYLKEIYRKFDVQSRAELLAKFIARKPLD